MSPRRAERGDLASDFVRNSNPGSLANIGRLAINSSHQPSGYCRMRHEKKTSDSWTGATKRASNMEHDRDVILSYYQVAGAPRQPLKRLTAYAPRLARAHFVARALSALIDVPRPGTGHWPAAGAPGQCHWPTLRRLASSSCAYGLPGHGTLFVLFWRFGAAFLRVWCQAVPRPIGRSEDARPGRTRLPPI